ncbi:RluA family pseudouridine synthase [Flavihumibacter sp. CACIAM 22H1]|uniref:RluA family pseudouridine synthase n=1 Tax=Flavihumibacter sp. CACIAM 22H1 TaxID=1812911 RepID=UPI0007A7DB8A|nr:RluA family pseudouridine synthase [Flavihumibacter sp. CACIAM 22H1]KYP14411.1 MAG: RNA pseudouridine synthase [Flavihumibacter sp. CACIAM 22H1]
MKSIRTAILQENSDWVAINKEAGLLSIPDREQSMPSLKDLLIKEYGSIYTVHRLDKETSGVILFAKNESSHQFLSRQFEERTTLKKYNGLVVGKVYEEAGTIDVPIGPHPAKPGQMMVVRKGKPSITLFKTLESFSLYSWMEFTILTGRTHQIRVHMQHLGHPIVSDPYYGDGKPFLLSGIKKKFKLGKDVLEERPLLNRLGLHASSLSFSDSSGERIELHAPLPKDLRASLQQLEKQR